MIDPRELRQQVVGPSPAQQVQLQYLLLIQKELEVLVRIAAGASPTDAMQAAGLELKAPARPEDNGGGG